MYTAANDLSMIRSFRRTTKKKKNGEHCPECKLYSLFHSTSNKNVEKKERNLLLLRAIMPDSNLFQ